MHLQQLFFDALLLRYNVCLSMTVCMCVCMCVCTNIFSKTVKSRYVMTDVHVSLLFNKKMVAVVTGNSQTNNKDSQ